MYQHPIWHLSLKIVQIQWYVTNCQFYKFMLQICNKGLDCWMHLQLIFWKLSCFEIKIFVFNTYNRTVAQTNYWLPVTETRLSHTTSLSYAHLKRKVSRPIATKWQTYERDHLVKLGQVAPSWGYLSLYPLISFIYSYLTIF